MIEIFFFLIIVCAFALSSVQAIKADKSQVNCSPNSFPYAWGYLWGYAHIYISTILLFPVFFSLLPGDSILKVNDFFFFIFGEGHFETKFLFRVLFILTGFGILRRQGWSWIVNLSLWIIVIFKEIYAVSSLDAGALISDCGILSLCIVWIFHKIILTFLNIVYVVKRWKQMSIDENS